MATKKTAKKDSSKATKKAPAKSKTAAKKTTAKKATVKKNAPASKATSTEADTFHLFEERQQKFIPAQQAKPVKVDGFDAFSFFLHKSADGKGWSISETTSGGRISVGFTQKEAKEKAREALGKHGAADLAESIKQSIAKHGAAPDFDAAKLEKRKFTVTTDDGISVDVVYDACMHNHLEFRGEISPTGYRSHFGYDGKGEVTEEARIIASDLRANFLKEQAKEARKGTAAEAKPSPQVTTRLKSKILAALVDEKKLPKEQVHIDDIAKATGAEIGDVAATLMVLELNRAIKSLPGKFFRLAKAEEQKPSGNRGRKPNGKSSQLDAAVDILKEAAEPLTCKEIVRRMFERKAWETTGRTPGATLSASMQREIAKRGEDSRFRRAERGLYELNA